MSRFPAFLLSALVATAVSAAPAPRPNVLLIVTDDQRPDTLGVLGNRSIETPHLDALARRGAAFPRALVAIPHCTPSRAEIMTGATGFRNGSPPFGRAMDPKLVLWAAAMRQGGYATWYAGKWMNDGNPRTRGYDETSGLFSSGGGGETRLTHPLAHNGRPATGYTGWTFKTNDGHVEREKGVGLTPTTDAHIADGAIALLRRPADRPFFLHVNFTGPHDPLHLPPGYERKYQPESAPLPGNFRAEHPFDHGNAGQRDELLLPLPRLAGDVRREVSAYYAVVSHVDFQVGRILAALRASGREANTIVIFTSDHGLALGSHGLMGKQNMYEHTVGVPLLMAGPGIPANRRLPAQVYLRDLYPTVCELTGVPVPATVEGRSFAPVLAGRVGEIHPEVYAYWDRGDAGPDFPVQRMVRTERWKLVYYAHLRRHQLFDLTQDPLELNDLAGRPEHGAVQADLQRKLDAWFAPRIEAAQARFAARKG